MSNNSKISSLIYTGFMALILVCLLPMTLLAQQNRFDVMEQRLKDLSFQTPGLNMKADLSVTNTTLQDFLKGLASTHNLNLNIDPSLTQHVTNYFSDEKVINILLYLAKQYNLDFTFVGSIITVTQYQDPLLNRPPSPKELRISYDPYSSNITLDLQDDSLLNVAKKITMLSNLNIVVEPELYGKKITGYIQNMPVTNAMEKLAISNSFKINFTNDSALVLEPLKADEEIVPKQKNNPNANFSIRKVNSNAGQNASSSVEVNNDSNGIKKVTLNVVNAPIKDVMKNIADQAGISYFVYSELAGTVTATINNMDFELALGYILQDTKFTFKTDNGVYFIGDRKDEGLRSKKLIQLQFRSVDSLLSVIPQNLKEGVEIKEFKELNSFLLSGSQPQINEIEAFVKEIDKLVPMITIEVILLDINKSHTVTTGIKAGTSDSIRTGGQILGGLDYTFGAADINRFISNLGLNNIFNIGRVSPNFYVSLSALESNNNINVRQTPKLSTLNGHVASLSIGNTVYYSVSTQNVLGSLNPQTVVTQQYIPVEANLAIDIMPIVSADENVTLTIGVSISSFTATPANQPPPTSTSRFKSIIRVKNEEMVVLGGIERSEKNETGSGVPFLSRIPILKWFFSSRSRTSSKVVSVVFIKPTIIYR